MAGRLVAIYTTAVGGEPMTAQEHARAVAGAGLDVYEHDNFIDYGTDRAAYIDAFFNNLHYDVVNDWVQRYGIRP